MAVAVRSEHDTISAALSVDGGVGSAGRYAAGVTGRYNAAVSHRIDEIETILFEGGVSAGYTFGRGDSDTNRAGDSHGHFASYEAVLGVGDRGTNDLLEAGGSTWDLPGSEEGIGTVRALIEIL